MKRTVQITADGSQTIGVEAMDVTYHSRHGAVLESMHVFIEAGLRFIISRQQSSVSIFEMGFGAGLNAFLSLQLAINEKLDIYYYAVEKFRLEENEWKQLNYGAQSVLQHAFEELHSCNWDEDVVISKNFQLHKENRLLQEVKPERFFDLIYFDAFAPSAQPELWTINIFEKMFSLLKPGGVLVTYCSKGDVRRAMIAAGFEVEKLPGPRGKREMLRATRN